MKCFFSLIMYVIQIKANNEDITLGNISAGIGKDKDGKLIGQGLMNVHDSRIDFGRDLLRTRFKETYGQTALSQQEKEKVQKIIERGAHGDPDTLNKLTSKGIITPEDAQALSNNASALAKITPHTHSKRRNNFPFIQNKKPTPSPKAPGNTMSTMTTTHTKTVYTNSMGPVQDVPPTQPAPDSPSSTKFKPAAPIPDEVAQDELEKEKRDAAQAEEDLKQRAYDHSLNQGLTPEEAEANANATAAYLREYKDLRAKGVSPKDADKKARKIFSDPENIAPNASNIFNSNRAHQLSRQFPDITKPGSLADALPSDFLLKEAEEARRKEEEDMANRKLGGKILSEALKHNEDVHNLINEKEQTVHKFLKEIQDLRNETIEGQIESNSQLPGELNNIDLQTILEEHTETYEEIVKGVHQEPAKLTYEELVKREHKNKDLIKKLQDQITEYIKIEQQNAAEKEDKVNKNIEKYEEQLDQQEKEELAKGNESHTELIDSVLAETDDTRANEDALFEEHITTITEHAGNTAYSNVINTGGTPEEAQEAKENAIKLKNDQIKQEYEEVIEQVKTELGTRVDEETAGDMAKHIVTVHELGDKYAKEAKKIKDQAAGVEPTAQSQDETTTTTATTTTTLLKDHPKVESRIPDVTSEITVENVDMSLPIKDIKTGNVETQEELVTETVLEERRDEYQNTVSGPTKKPVYTGIPSAFDDKTGMTTTFNNGVTGMDGVSGTVTVTEETYEDMVQSGKDTSPFQKQVTDDGTFYVMELEDAVISVGSEHNRGEGTTITQGEEEYHLGQTPAKLHMKKGTVKEEPSEGMKKFQRPVIKNKKPKNDDTDDAMDEVEEELINSFIEDRKSQDKQKGKDFTVTKGFGGGAVAVQETEYGTPVVQTLPETQQQAAESLKPTQPSKTKPNGNPLNMDDREQTNEDGVETFLETVHTEITEHTTGGNEPFIIKDKKERTPEDDGEIQETAPKKNENGETLTPEEAVQQHTETNTIAQQAANNATSGTSQTHDATTTDATTETVQTITTYDDKHPPKPEGSPQQPSLTKPNKVSTPLNSKNPFNGQHDPTIETHTQQTVHTTEVIHDAMLPPTTPENDVNNQLLDHATEITEIMHIPVTEYIQIIQSIDKDALSKLMDAMRNGAPREEINNLLYKLIQDTPALGSKDGKTSPLLKLLMRIISKYLGVSNPAAPLTQMVPVSNATANDLRNRANATNNNGSNGQNNNGSNGQNTNGSNPASRIVQAVELPKGVKPQFGTETGGNPLVTNGKDVTPEYKATHPSYYPTTPSANPNINYNPGNFNANPMTQPAGQNTILNNQVPV